ncbi:hypothetical protein [Aliamphritea spongicola]|uniref:hypothetical protein n=1 Tax=Aliamphritea spongicola TaxID=707589 RepID=UPI00196AD75D|nr:hypothetical protein [Aliamphritea spongicola]MBN3564209.1 hypothetical protein [Aliamphritea spongicola]
MTSVTLLLLTLSGGYSAVWQHRQTADQETGINQQVLALSSLFIALSAAAQLLIGTQSEDLFTLRQMLENLAYFAGIPLIATAAVALSLGKTWTKPAWGRWLIGLFAFFELLRQMQYGAQYAQLIALTASAALLYAAVRQQQPHNKLLLIAGSVLIAAGLTTFSQGALLTHWQDPALFSICLAAGIPMLFMGNRRC